MMFPISPRIIYRSNPINIVICQFRFPPILRVDSESPAAFQEMIRRTYPGYRSQPKPPVPAGVPAEFAKLFAVNLGGASPIVHEFLSQDSKWTVVLERDSLTLNCLSYGKWEDFKGRFGELVDSLEKIYSPDQYTRIGLRYRNIIKPEEFGLENNLDWSLLLQPWIVGVHHAKNFSGRIQASLGQFALESSDGLIQLMVNHGTAVDEKTKLACYVLDADSYCEKPMEVGDGIGRLDDLHDQARLFFDWCVTDRFRVAMDPTSIQGP